MEAQTALVLETGAANRESDPCLAEGNVYACLRVSCATQTWTPLTTYLVRTMNMLAKRSATR